MTNTASVRDIQSEHTEGWSSAKRSRLSGQFGTFWRKETKVGTDNVVILRPHGRRRITDALANWEPPVKTGWEVALLFVPPGVRVAEGSRAISYGLWRELAVRTSGFWPAEAVPGFEPLLEDHISEPDLLTPEEAASWDAGPLNPEDVLERIQDSTLTHTDKRQLIIEAEAFDFTLDQKRILAPILFEFIKEYRSSGDEEDIIAVGSAIREYVAIISVTEIGSLTELLEPRQANGLPLEVEIEIVKMISRKFTANPPPEGNPQPHLSEALVDVVKAYANPRVLPREKFAAITLNALLGLVAMRVPSVDELVKEVVGLSFFWFTDLLRRRIIALAHEWESRLPVEKRPESLSYIEGVLATIPAQSA